MATITFPAIKLDLEYTTPGGSELASFESSAVEVDVRFRGREGFFVYEVIDTPPDGLPEISFTDDNINSARIGRTSLSGADLLLGDVTFVGGAATLFAFSSERGAQETLVVIQFDGDDLPTIDTAEAFEDFIAGATFSEADDPFAPGERIELDAIGGDDGLVLTPGDDVFRGTRDDDVVDGAGGDDRLFGRSGDDSLSGGAGDDTLSGAGGRDALMGGEDNDLIRGQGGADVLEGGAGEDRLDGGGGADRLSGGDDNDHLDGRGGGDELNGGAGDDTLLGRGGRDELEGDDGDDRLSGGGGRDTLDGGEGDDELNAGGGRDVLIFNVGDGADRVVRYNDNQDIIAIESGAASFDTLIITQEGDDALIAYGDVDGDGTVDDATPGAETILLVNTDSTLLEADDFLFG